MPITRRGPRWESVDQVQISPTRLKRLSQSWFSRSGLLTVRHPSPLTLPRLDSLAVVTAPTPPQPELDKPHRAPAAPRRSGPSCWLKPPAPASAACGRACAPAMSEPGRQRALAHLRCLAEPLLAPARALNRGPAEPSREIATAPERVGRWGQRRESRGRHSPDARDGHQATRHRILLGMPGDLAVEHGNALVQRSELLDQHSQNGPSCLGQIGGGILQGSDEL